MAAFTVFWIYLYSICCVNGEEISFEVGASPGLQRQKIFQVSLTMNLTWFGAVNDCHRQGYQTLVYSSKYLERIQTVRKSLQNHRGYSNIKIWTGFIKNYYSWSNTSEWLREYNCLVIDSTAYGINDIRAGTDQCVFADVVDQGKLSLYADDCLQKHAYVCYTVLNSDVEMLMFTKDVYYNFTHNEYTTSNETGTTFSDCSAPCVTSRYCVAAVFASDVPQCWHVYSYLEAEVNITLHKGNNTSYTIGIKQGDKVLYDITNISAQTGTSDALPCRQSEPSSLLPTPKTSESITPSTVQTNFDSSFLDVVYSSSFQNSPSTESADLLFISATEYSGISLQATPLDMLTDTTDYMTSSIMSSFTSDVTAAVISSTEELSFVYSNSYTMKSISDSSTLASSSAVQSSTYCYCVVYPDTQNSSSTVISRLDKRKLSNFRRRFFSAGDTRLSSKVMGVTGAVVIVTTILIFIISDLSVIYKQHIKNLRPTQKV